MRKSLPKRILAFTLAVMMLFSNLISAFAAKRADVYGSGGLANYSFANGAQVAAAHPNGICTGLTWEETDVKPATGYSELGGSFWYGKHWAGSKSPASGAVSLKGEDSTKINVDFSKVANTFLTCIEPHIGGSDIAVSVRGCQLFANYVYLPTEKKENYPDYIQAKYSDFNDLKFYYYLFALLQSCPDAPPTASTLDDPVADTYKSMLVFAYSRCLEEGDLSGGANSNPDTDWNIVKNKLADMYSAGVPTAWSQMCSAGETDFKKYWERAAFFSCLSAKYDGGNVFVSLPVSEAQQGSDGKWHMTFDYSSVNEKGRQYLQKVTQSAGSSKLTFTNNGSSIDISAASEADITDATELGSIIMSCPDFPEAPVLCVELQPIGVAPNWAAKQRAEICGQNRFAVTNMPLEIRLAAGSGVTPTGEGEVKRYEHTETFTATYNIDIRKYDSETGKGLSDCEYEVTHVHNEALLDDENWDENTISDDCAIEGAKTNSEGQIANMSDGETGHTDVRTYSYHKGYCGGHPMPAFVDIPEEEEDEEGNVTNEGEIEAAKAENDELITKWFNDVVLCCKMETEGGYFCKADEAGYSEGSTPTTGCDSKEEYESQCAEIATAQEELETDRNEKYSEFIAITYTYDIEEIRTKNGYILHGKHTDDIPLETKIVWSSEYMDGAVIAAVDFDDDVLLTNIRVAGASPVEKALGIMTAYADELSEEKKEEIIEEQTGEKEEETEEEGNTGDKEENEEITEPEEEAEEDLDPDEASVSDADIIIENDLEDASISELDEASLSELEEAYGIMDMLSEVWQGVLGFFRNAKEAVEEAADNVLRLLKAPLMFAGFGAGSGDTSGGTVGTKGLFGGWLASEVAFVPEADNSIINHTWIVFDHRTEGEIHLTKKDLNLDKNDGASYDAYGDTNGDGSLEGAAYGLFAASDVVHPDGHTGVVYHKDELCSIATTDRNGDLSFNFYTEAPGYVWSYETGKVVKDTSYLGFTGPNNMHRTMGQNETKFGTQDYVGHTSDGAEESIDDYASGGADFYKKVSSNQAHIEGITRNGCGNYAYPIYNNELNNGNCWIGRPLIVGGDSCSYYVRELTRSEGYELSISGKSNQFTNGKDSYKANESLNVKIENKRIEAGETIKSALAADVTAFADGGVADDIVIKVPGVHNWIKAALSKTTSTTVQKIAAKPRTTQETVIGTDGTPVIFAGERIEAKVGDTKTVGANTWTVTKVSSPEEQTTALVPTTIAHNTYPAPDKILEKVNAQSGDAVEKLIAGFNEAFFDNGFDEPDSNAPWVKVDLSLALSQTERITAVLNALAGEKAATYATRIKLVENSGSVYIRYDHYDKTHGKLSDSFCDIENGVVYSRMDSGKGYFLYVPFEETDAVPGSWVSTSSGGYTFVTSALIPAKEIDTDLAPDKFADIDILAVKSSLKDIPAKSYWLYDGVMPQLENDGSIHKADVTRTIVPTDPEWGDMAYKDILWEYYNDVEKTESIVSLSIVNKDGNPITAGDEDSYIVIPAASFAGVSTVVLKVYDNGDDNYMPSLATSLAWILPSQKADSYVPTITLEYPGDAKVVQDAGTIDKPVVINERPIRQKVTLNKDILTMPGDTYENNTYDFGVISKQVNFRFKAYLKSNLERMYRDEDGNVVFTDRNGNVMTPVYTDNDSDGEYDEVSWKYASAYSGKTVDYPETDVMDSSDCLNSVNVPKVYTQVAHESASLTAGARANNLWNIYLTPQGAGAGADLGVLKREITTAKTGTGNEAIVSNAALYSYDGKNTNAAVTDKLNAAANSGYTRILEYTYKTVEDNASTKQVLTENYDKFFDAIDAANKDKWDEKNPTYTSYKPIENILNRGVKQIENAMRSDAVRQFAITWYLDDEAAKLLKNNGYTEDEAKEAIESNSYSDKLYDEALNEAIKKAEFYLKPFYANDLDAIYSIGWDSEAKGGKDEDLTTLSLDKAAANGTVGTSAYLPYGDYVVREVTPFYVGDKDYNDFINKHFRTDRPKVIKVPSLYEGNVSGDTSDNYDSHYKYSSTMPVEDMGKAPAEAGGYLIRFNEEWMNATVTPEAAALQSKWVIRAHSYNGDQEVYKWGLDTDRANGGTISSGSGSYAYLGFLRTQSALDPIKDYYKTTHTAHKMFGDGSRAAIGSESGGNDQSSYKMTAKAINTAQTANCGYYETAEYEKRVAYGAVSEDAGVKGDCVVYGGTVTADNPKGMQVVSRMTMTGELTAIEGEYASMLVPWTVTEGTNDAKSFTGTLEQNERNTYYYSKLRIEKLDSETHENVLHDQAMFAIYKAQRYTETSGGHVSGEVKFYDTDTDITGSKEFIESYCVKSSARPVDPKNPRGTYQGTVKAGTPICHEADKVILGDRFGRLISEFRSYSTAADLSAKGEYIYQNAGYLTTPQPLGAGVYVLVEESAPSGYVRTKPIAVEIYSDAVTYYKEGNKDERILAAIYEQNIPDDVISAHRNKVFDREDVATVYVENTPIKLTFEKVKESSIAGPKTTADKSVTYKVSARVDGALDDIGGRNDLVYVYDSSRYKGYAYYKGSLEYFASLKAAYETDADTITKAEVIYDGTEFAGYAYVTRSLESADDANAYVTEATMTMFDALQLRRNDDYDFGKSDYAFSFPEGGVNHALIIERDYNHNIKRMYVEEGYAGVKTAFKPVTDEDGNPIPTSYVTGYREDGSEVVTDGIIWQAQTIERHDTDILYYDLDSLTVFSEENIDGTMVKYAYLKDGTKIPLARVESDKGYISKTDNENSIYAFKGGTAYLEFVGGDFTKISYSSTNKTLSVDADTLVYHLDADGNRDSLVDPYTGMAYVVESVPKKGGGMMDKYLVWAINIAYDAYGNVISRDKIATSRVATIFENADAYSDSGTVSRAADPSGSAVAGTAAEYEHLESGTVGGAWESAAGEQSHNATTDKVTKYNGLNLNGQILLDDNNGSFAKKYSPVYDSHGNIIYYQKSPETYDKGTDLYDRNEDYERYKDYDNLEEYNLAAYTMDDHGELYDAGRALSHRYGEGYVLENTWVTSDKYPNDPFMYHEMDGQADILKRVPYGTYIIEEVKAPKGYQKGLPVGLTINETSEMHHSSMVDKTTKLEIAKLDSSSDYNVDIFDESSGEEVAAGITEQMMAYSQGFVTGAQLTLYKAKQIFSSDYEKYPKGYYLVKDATEPFEYESSDSTESSPKSIKCQWTVGTDTIYLERIPQGYYVLEETVTPKGFVTSPLIGIKVDTRNEVKEVIVDNDHTKTEIEKYYTDGDGNEKQLKGAAFELYAAKVDGGGNVIYNPDGTPQTDGGAITEFISSSQDEYADFIKVFEQGYKAYGSGLASLTYTNDEGTDINVTVTGVSQLDASLAGGVMQKYADATMFTLISDDGRSHRAYVFGRRQEHGKAEYSFEYEFDYKELSGVSDYAVSYATRYGQRRFDYLPQGQYVAHEVSAPYGYIKASDVLITVHDSTDVSRYYIEDQKPMLVVSKIAYGQTKEAKGVGLSLYKADAGGELTVAPEYLIDSWVTGEDGTYTALDKNHGKIISASYIDDDGNTQHTDYKVGDLRPHKIENLESGTYYLVETDALPYYKAIEPRKITYIKGDEAVFVRAINHVVDGELTIKKEDEEGSGLSGATYNIKGYLVSDLVHPVYNEDKVSTSDVLTLSLPVGVLDADGMVSPYIYVVTEKYPPEGYRTSIISHRFTFEPDKEEEPYAASDIARIERKFTDYPTVITLRKKDFDSLGSDESDAAFIDGAKMSVYLVTGTDMDGNAIYDASSPVKSFVTEGKADSYEIKSLIAGKTYILVETDAPDGYNLMKSVVFTLSADGRKVSSLSNKAAALTVNYVSDDLVSDSENRDRDSIASVTIKGRYAVKSMYKLYSGATLIDEWPGTTGTHTIDTSCGIADGDPVTVDEVTSYSDGSDVITNTKSFNLHYNDDGKYVFKCREVSRVALMLERDDTSVVDAFEPTSSVYEKTIDNGICVENPSIKLYRHGEAVGTPLAKDEIILGSIGVYNPYHVSKKVTVKITAGTGTTIVDKGMTPLTSYQFDAFDLDAYAATELEFALRSTADAAKITAQISYEGEDTVTGEKEVPLLQDGKLVLFNELTGSGKDIYADEETSFVIKLINAETDKELPGAYHYTGSRDGYISSGQTLMLAGNEYVTIDTGIYKNVRYEVSKVEDAKATTALKESGSYTADTAGYAAYTRAIEDTSERLIFKKGEKYIFREVTEYTDGFAFDSNRLSVTLGDDDEVDTITPTDRLVDVEIDKISLVTKENVEGAVLALYDSTDALVAEWTEDGYGNTIDAELLVPGEKYTLKEISVPHGYNKAKDITFTVNTFGTTDKIDMVDVPTRVRIRKVDPSGRFVKGALLQILDKDSNPLVPDIQFTSGEDATMLTAVLEPDTEYVLHEITPPAGYAAAEDVPFTVLSGKAITEVTMVDTLKPTPPTPPSPSGTAITVCKVDTQGNPIAGAQISAVDAGGNPYTVTVNAEGDTFRIQLESTGRVFITETAAPEGRTKIEKTYEVNVGSSTATLVNGDDKFYQDKDNGFKFYLVNERRIGWLTALFDPIGKRMGKYKIRFRGKELEWIRTGDDRNAAVPIAVIIVAAIALGGIIIAGKKGGKKDDEDEK